MIDFAPQRSTYPGDRMWDGLFLFLLLSLSISPFDVPVSIRARIPHAGKIICYRARKIVQPYIPVQCSISTHRWSQLKASLLLPRKPRARARANCVCAMFAIFHLFSTAPECVWEYVAHSWRTFIFISIAVPVPWTRFTVMGVCVENTRTRTVVATNSPIEKETLITRVIVGKVDAPQGDQQEVIFPVSGD